MIRLAKTNQISNHNFYYADEVNSLMNAATGPETKGLNISFILSRDKQLIEFKMKEFKMKPKASPVLTVTHRQNE